MPVLEHRYDWAVAKGGGAKGAVPQKQTLAPAIIPWYLLPQLWLKLPQPNTFSVTIW